MERAAVSREKRKLAYRGGADGDRRARRKIRPDVSKSTRPGALGSVRPDEVDLDEAAEGLFGGPCERRLGLPAASPLSEADQAAGPDGRQLAGQRWMQLQRRGQGR
jgi:hypothetical protein